jgi:ATP-dependent helicase/nuclease subunit B
LHATPAYRLAGLLHGWQSKWPAAFAGFVEPTSAQRALGISESLVTGSAPGRIFTAAAADPVDEIHLAAQWCHARLQEDPQRRLLIVVPDLAQRRAAALRSLEQALSPLRELGMATDGTGPLVAIEGGQPLAHYPLVRHALDSLRLLVGQLDFASLSSWLRAPFWQAPSDMERTRLDLWLRNWLRPESSATDLHSQLETVPTGLVTAATQLRGALAIGLASVQRQPTGATQWSRRFVTALAAFGWPGTRPLSSAEHQTRARFMELLDEFAALGAAVGRLSAGAAVGTLHKLAARIAFEPATGDAAITLTDMLVDPIVRYDGIWIAGLHADSWPGPVNVDPFIPLGAQRAAAIPACSAAGRLSQARALLRIWQACTGQLVMSWPQRSEDGEHLASALLEEIRDAEPLGAQPRRPSLAQAVRGAVTLESFEDPGGAPWSSAVVLPSGARSLEYQNLCPFRAYAELRLGCAQLETPRPGVDLRDRGQLLHRALEYLWTQLADSSGLESHRGTVREELIEDCIERATRDCFDETILREAPRAVARERRRASRLIGQLCELEEQRAPFRVQALEARRQLNIAGASLDVRIDRIDELADGTLAIFDYKSGKSRPQDWLEERPSNPQLLVYLRAAHAPVAALAAVHLTASRVNYRGIADRNGRLPKVAGLDEAWPQQLDRWRNHVEALAIDFLAGRAVLDPLGDACRRCHMHCFCRIADAVSSSDGAEQDD